MKNIKNSFTRLERYFQSSKSEVERGINAGSGLRDSAKNIRKNSLTGFTMLEIMTVLIIAALMLVLAFPVFKKTIEKSRQKLALTNLKLILAGENLYRLTYEHYYPDGVNSKVADLEDINKKLNLDLKSKYYNYKVEADSKYHFLIHALDKNGKTIFSLDPQGNIIYPGK